MSAPDWFRCINLLVTHDKLKVRKKSNARETLAVSRAYGTRLKYQQVREPSGAVGRFRVV